MSDKERKLACPWCVEKTMEYICSYGSTEGFRCRVCNKTMTIKEDGKEMVTVGYG